MDDSGELGMMPATHGVIEKQQASALGEFEALATVTSGVDVIIGVSAQIGDIIEFTVNGIIQQTTVSFLGSVNYSTSGNLGVNIGIKIFGTPTSFRLRFGNWETIDITRAITLTTFTQMFASESSLTSVTLLNYPNVTDSVRMFSASGIINAPDIIATNFTAMNQMFDLCGSVVSVPAYDSENSLNMAAIYKDTPNLICIGGIDTILAATQTGGTTDMFLNTPLLTNPTPAEQTAILSGSNYVNANPCP